MNGRVGVKTGKSESMSYSPLRNDQTRNSEMENNEMYQWYSFSNNVQPEKVLLIVTSIWHWSTVAIDWEHKLWVLISIRGVVILMQQYSLQYNRCCWRWNSLSMQDITIRDRYSFLQAFSNTWGTGSKEWISDYYVAEASKIRVQNQWTQVEINCTVYCALI